MSQQDNGETMNTIPPISELSIRRFAGEKNYVDGKKHFRNGLLHNFHKQGMMLKGDYSGPDGRLAMKVTFDTRGPTSATCPCGNRGQCKHIAALLVAWQEQPWVFTESGMMQSNPHTEGTRQQQVEDIFQLYGYKSKAEVKVAADLSKMQTIADSLAEQGDYVEATVIYKEIVLGIMKHYGMFQSHDEGGDLVVVVRECVDGLGWCLDESAENIETRQAILEVLFAIYREDVEAGGYSFEDAKTELLLEHTKYEERRTIAIWVRKSLTAYDASGQRDYRRKMYTDFLFELEAETLDEDEYLQACREEGRVVDLVDQLLKLGRIGEATKEAEQTNNQDLFKIADILVKRGYRANAKRLMQERANNKDTTQANDILIQIWLNNHP
jgi:uncharacterized Zn finger protein